MSIKIQERSNQVNFKIVIGSNGQNVVLKAYSLVRQVVYSNELIEEYNQEGLTSTV